MKHFVLMANIKFDAENIGAAFDKLAEHFRALSTSTESRLDFIGEIRLEKEQDNGPLCIGTNS